MIASLEISKNRGYITESDMEQALDMLKLYGFPTSISGITIDDIVAISKSDKKMDAGKINIILLNEIGNAYVDKTVTDKEMKKALEKLIK